MPVPQRVAACCGRARHKAAEPGPEQWRTFLAVARQWRDAVNKHGGDATLVHLPELGIRGNTHFPMSDLNSIQIADLRSG